MLEQPSLAQGCQCRSPSQHIVPLSQKKSLSGKKKQAPQVYLNSTIAHPPTLCAVLVHCSGCCDRCPAQTASQIERMAAAQMVLVLCEAHLAGPGRCLGADIRSQGWPHSPCPLQCLRSVLGVPAIHVIAEATFHLQAGGMWLYLIAFMFLVIQAVRRMALLADGPIDSVELQYELKNYAQIWNTLDHVESVPTTESSPRPILLCWETHRLFLWDPTPYSHPAP